jgi:hypothetical protein
MVLSNKYWAVLPLICFFLHFSHTKCIGAFTFPARIYVPTWHILFFWRSSFLIVFASQSVSFGNISSYSRLTNIQTPGVVFKRLVNDNIVSIAVSNFDVFWQAFGHCGMDYTIVPLFSLCLVLHQLFQIHRGLNFLLCYIWKRKGIVVKV